MKLYNIFYFYFLGLCLGIFVTRQCTTTTSSAANHLHHATQASPVKEKRINGSTKSKSGNSNNGTNDIHNYSVTTISTNCNESNKSHSVDSSFKQISAYETGWVIFVRYSHLWIGKNMSWTCNESKKSHSVDSSFLPMKLMAIQGESFIY